MGEVTERSEDGEGKRGCMALSVTFGDSSPRGRAKGLMHGKWSVSVLIRSISTPHQKRGRVFYV